MAVAAIIRSTILVLVVQVLLAVGADLVRPGGQFHEGDSADRHLVREFRGIDPAAQHQDVGVEQALPGRLRYRGRGLTAHRDRSEAPGLPFRGSGQIAV
jgi:hypothetical protein